MLRLINKLEDGFSGNRITVLRHMVGNDQTKFIYEVVKVDDTVAMLPVVKELDVDCFVLLKNHRYPTWINGQNYHIFEVPAGKIEPGEMPMAAAVRELKEGTGLTANMVEGIGEWFTSPGITTEKIYGFVMSDLTLRSEQGVKVVHIPIPDAINRCLEFGGDICDMKTAAMILWYAAKHGSI